MASILSWVAGALSNSPYLGQQQPMQHYPGELAIPRNIRPVDVTSVVYRNELVEKMILLVKIHRNLDVPQTTDDLKVGMMSMINSVTYHGQMYMERVWWVPKAHPVVPFIQMIVRSGRDERWECLGMVGSKRLGMAFVYTDETINCMLRELLVMFEDQNYQLEDLIPNEEEEEEEEEEKEEKEEKDESIVIDIIEEKKLIYSTDTKKGN